MNTRYFIGSDKTIIIGKLLYSEHIANNIRLANELDNYAKLKYISRMFGTIIPDITTEPFLHFYYLRL